jgi:chemotaxis protein MotA
MAFERVGVDYSAMLGVAGVVTMTVMTVAWSGDAEGYVHPPSFALVLFGGTFASIIGCSFETIRDSARLLVKSFRRGAIDRRSVAAEIVSLASSGRREGIASLEDRLTAETSAILSAGVLMAIDGHEPETIETVLDQEIASLFDRRRRQRRIFESMAKYFPAFGLIGTLIGLVAMLQRLDDPKSIGPGMATALLTTLYGALSAYGVVCPALDRVNALIAEEIEVARMSLDGALAVQAGENQSTIERRLRPYLTAK